MDNLVEWHHGAEAGLQLAQDAGNAGKTGATFVVTDLRARRASLRSAGLEVSEIEPVTVGSIVRIEDPDGNRIVLAQP